jgi:hypothetical protein
MIDSHVYRHGPPPIKSGEGHDGLESPYVNLLTDWYDTVPIKPRNGPMLSMTQIEFASK